MIFFVSKKKKVHQEEKDLDKPVMTPKMRFVVALIILILVMYMS